jgi:hypothetical protein
LRSLALARFSFALLSQAALKGDPAQRETRRESRSRGTNAARQMSQSSPSFVVARRRRGGGGGRRTIRDDDDDDVEEEGGGGGSDGGAVSGSGRSGSPMPDWMAQHASPFAPGAAAAPAAARHRLAGSGAH